MCQSRSIFRTVQRFAVLKLRHAHFEPKKQNSCCQNNCTSSTLLIVLEAWERDISSITQNKDWKRHYKRITNPSH